MSIFVRRGGATTFGCYQILCCLIVCLVDCRDMLVEVAGTLRLPDQTY